MENESIRRRYLEDFIRESNSSLVEELNVRSLEDLLVSEEVLQPCGCYHRVITIYSVKSRVFGYREVSFD